MKNSLHFIADNLKRAHCTYTHMHNECVMMKYNMQQRRATTKKHICSPFNWVFFVTHKALFYITLADDAGVAHAIFHCTHNSIVLNCILSFYTWNSPRVILVLHVVHAYIHCTYTYIQTHITCQLCAFGDPQIWTNSPENCMQNGLNFRGRF